MSHKHPELALAFHIPNGGSRNVIEAVKLKRTGVKPGIPDIFIPVPNNFFYGLFIEMKKPKGRVSPEQQEWIKKLNNLGYLAAVCFSADEAIKLICEYFSINVN